MNRKIWQHLDFSSHSLNFSSKLGQSIGMTIFLNNDQGNLLCLPSISSLLGGYDPSF